MVANIQLRLTLETEEDGRARPENDTATKRLRLAMETDEEKQAKLEKMITNTAQAVRQRKKEEQKNGFDLIWI